MKANNVKEAWAMVDEIFPTAYEKDDQSSASAGYPIYRSTLDASCTDTIGPGTARSPTSGAVWRLP